ncbi:phosphate/phosphite/phosphonate ABC transporter substrate-binding protein [Gammaproteobacteria bacterium]|nr:phosphate/phosphite/phosphonate ABC transporter substrate-binding protein [Gammaproteobacteria bacterium]
MNLKNKIIGIFLGLIIILPLPVLSADPQKLNMVFVPASEKGDNQDYESLIEIIERLADIKIKPIRVTDYNAAVESMRAGRAHIAWYGGKTYIQAAEMAGAEAFAAGVRKGDDTAGYYAYFVVPVDSPLKTLEDVRGQILGLNSIGSTSGDLIPQVELMKVGLSTKNKNDFAKVFYAGSHDACLLAAINKHVDVCGMSSRNFDARLTDGTFKLEQVRIIHRSSLVPPPPLAYSKKLSVELRDRIKKATLEAHKHGKIGGYGGEMSHYIEVTDSDYDLLREMDSLLSNQ